MNQSVKNKLTLYHQWDMLPELAVEAHELLRSDNNIEIPGVQVTEETDTLANIHTVTILDQQGSRIMQKPEGTYVTIQCKELATNHHGIIDSLSLLVARQLEKFIHLSSLQDPVLVVGLGNWKSTPDALGSRVISQITATRHLYGNGPDSILEGVRPVATIAPGVLGMTGIESADIIRSTVKQIQPAMLIVIDSLAAGDSSRIGTTIQISDSGIVPGSGVGNRRKAITKETIGIPVISIGIPTVVKARIIAHNVLESFLDQLAMHPKLQPVLKTLPEPAVQNLMHQALLPCQHNLEVTPKEIDSLVQNCSLILSRAITQTLHPNMNTDFAASFF